MKNYTLKFDKTAERGQGWRMSHKENGSKFSSLICSMDEKKYYVSSTKKLQEALDNDPAFRMENINVVTLYNKTLLEVGNNANNQISIAVMVEAEKGEKIAAVKLDEAGATFQRVSEDGTKVAFIAVTTGTKWRIRIYQTNKKVISINNEGKIINETVNHEIKIAERGLRIKSLLALPKKAIFTRFENVQAMDSEEGFIPVSIARVLSNYTVLVKVPETMIFGESVTQEEVKMIMEKINMVQQESKATCADILMVESQE